MSSVMTRLDAQEELTATVSGITTAALTLGDEVWMVFNEVGPGYRSTWDRTAKCYATHAAVANAASRAVIWMMENFMLLDSWSSFVYHNMLHVPEGLSYTISRTWSFSLHRRMSTSSCAVCIYSRESVYSELPDLEELSEHA